MLNPSKNIDKDTRREGLGSIGGPHDAGYQPESVGLGPPPGTVTDEFSNRPFYRSVIPSQAVQ